MYVNTCEDIHSLSPHTLSPSLTHTQPNIHTHSLSHTGAFLSGPGGKRATQALVELVDRVFTKFILALKYIAHVSSVIDG
jgi:hypothetical protein